MSTRSNVYKYGGNSNAGLPAGSGYNLLAALFGNDKVTGGIQAMPDGSYSFNPYQGSTGLFSGASKRRAAELNADIAPTVLDIQSRKALQQLIGSQAMEQLGIKGTNELNSIKETGNQGRLTEVTRGEEGRKTEIAKGEQARITAQDATINALAAKYGIHPADVEQLRGLMTRNASQSINQEYEARNDPGVVSNMRRGINATSLSPEVANAAKLSTTAQMGGISAMPNVPGVTDRGFNTAVGAVQNQEQLTGPGGIPMGTRLAMKPGQMIPSVNPDIVNRVMNSEGNTMFGGNGNGIGYDQQQPSQVSPIPGIGNNTTGSIQPNIPQPHTGPGTFGDIPDAIKQLLLKIGGAAGGMNFGM